MDVQIKIKILKSFDHGLQKPFIKTKKREFPQTFGSFSPHLKKKKI